MVARYQVFSGLRVAGSRVAAMSRNPLVGPYPLPPIPSSSSATYRTRGVPWLSKRTVHDQASAGSRAAASAGVKAGGWAGSSTICQVPWEGRKPMM